MPSVPTLSIPIIDFTFLYADATFRWLIFTVLKSPACLQVLSHAYKAKSSHIRTEEHQKCHYKFSPSCCQNRFSDFSLIISILRKSHFASYKNTPLSHADEAVDMPLMRLLIYIGWRQQAFTYHLIILADYTDATKKPASTFHILILHLATHKLYISRLPLVIMNKIFMPNTRYARRHAGRRHSFSITLKPATSKNAHYAHEKLFPISPGKLSTHQMLVSRRLKRKHRPCISCLPFMSDICLSSAPVEESEHALELWWYYFMILSLLGIWALIDICISQFSITTLKFRLGQHT